MHTTLSLSTPSLATCGTLYLSCAVRLRGCMSGRDLVKWIKKRAANEIAHVSRVFVSMCVFFQVLIVRDTRIAMPNTGRQIARVSKFGLFWCPWLAWLWGMRTWVDWRHNSEIQRRPIVCKLCANWFRRRRTVNAMNITTDSARDARCHHIFLKHFLKTCAVPFIFMQRAQIPLFLNHTVESQTRVFLFLKFVSTSPLLKHHHSS